MSLPNRQRLLDGRAETERLIERTREQIRRMGFTSRKARAVLTKLEAEKRIYDRKLAAP